MQPGLSSAYQERKTGEGHSGFLPSTACSHWESFAEQEFSLSPRGLPRNIPGAMRAYSESNLFYWDLTIHFPDGGGLNGQ
jgi:hypothetical protein